MDIYIFLIIIIKFPKKELSLLIINPHQDTIITQLGIYKYQIRE